MESFINFDLMRIKSEFMKNAINILDNLNLKIIIKSKYPIKSFDCKKEKMTESKMK